MYVGIYIPSFVSNIRSRRLAGDRYKSDTRLGASETWVQPRHLQESNAPSPLHNDTAVLSFFFWLSAVDRFSIIDVPAPAGVLGRIAKEGQEPLFGVGASHWLVRLT